MGRGRSRFRGRDVSGILLFDKPAGISSNQALQRVKRLFGARKAGHTGNLDVLATGLLPVCFGEATKLCAFLLDADKHYSTTLRLGEQTTTGDAEGEVIFAGPVDGIDRTRFEAVAQDYRGEIEQVPPMFSALKQGGQPLYKLAHKGIEVERAPRPTVIYELRLTRLEGAEADLEVRCAKGTYIRTLGEDIGRDLGCGAHVIALRRTGVGPFQLDDAYDLAALEGIAADGGNAALDGLLRPLDSALPEMPAVNLTEDAAHYLTRGQAVLVPRAPTHGQVRVYDHAGVFLGIGEVLDDGRIGPRRLLRTDG
ncbi:MAG: tRNA pseudouridine(55) synthase TruB [Gammaproteobacteria bacterium]|nr:tRNA pseudouridine(55) synthase TruB [Gammaproteobacteria bacterium]